jgi:asparagine synthase (glutamine-hydrolysing)
MSGIAGIIYTEKFQVRNLLSPMLDTMAHRGKNERQELTYKNFQVGICGGKLAESNKMIAGLDGVISNSKTLRAILLSKGSQILSDNEAELLIHAYLLWGSSFLEHIRGDFAFFLLDQTKESIILARDRIGKKPLYWYQSPHFFIFASELKGILASSVVPQIPALDALAAYLYFGYIPQDMSPIKDINKLLPGYYLHLHADQSKNIQSYWSFSSYFSQKNLETKSMVATHLDALLQDAVSESIPKNKKFGCFLSGGLGSYSAAYYLSKNVPKPSAYSVCFQGESEQDMQTVSEVAECLELEHISGLVTPQKIIDDWTKIAWYLDEPLADPNVLATWRLTELAQSSPIVFSGAASDELLAGHNRYKGTERSWGILNRISRSSTYMFKRLIIPIMFLFSKRHTFELLQKTRKDPWQVEYLNQNALFTHKIRLAAAPRIAHLFDPNIFLHRFYNLSRIHSKISTYLYLDIKTSLVDNYIMQYERFTTAQGLDWRTPFLTQPIVEYLAGLPEQDKLMEPESFFALKTILKGCLPSTVINRPKKTQKGSLNSWGGEPEVIKYFQKLSKGALVEAGIISEKWLRQNTATSQKCIESFRCLWSILALEIWFRLYINNPIQSKPPKISLNDLLI